VYLVLLGAQALRAAFRRRGDDDLVGLDGSTTRLMPRQAFRRGLISNLSNPKMVAFFPSLLPQFVPDGHAGAVALPFLGVLFSCMTLAWLSAYTLVVVRIGGYLRRSSVRRLMDGVLGAVLIGLGVRLALERR
jgi:threonine/homoserine/homoserine lactone efflux protein